MRPAEADWLRDRILDSAGESLLAHLVVDAPSDESTAPWEDAAALRARGEPAVLLAHARAFSAVMQGAQLLYNLMLAEQYEAAGFDRVDPQASRYRERMLEWAASLRSHVDIEAWDLDDLIRRVTKIRNSPVNPRSLQFVREWLSLLRTEPLADLPDNAGARILVTNRERQNKGAQARLKNMRRLQAWGGASGAGALTYRWGTVRTILNDIHDGLERTDA